jgi:purine-binding chemotaxis protein CheW
VFTVVIILNLEGGTTGVVVDAVSDVLRLRAEDVREAPDLGAGQLPIQGLATLEGRMVVLVDIARMLGGAVEAPGVALAA